MFLRRIANGLSSEKGKNLHRARLDCDKGTWFWIYIGETRILDFLCQAFGEETVKEFNGVCYWGMQTFGR